MNPEISVVMPAYNSAKYIEKTIDSILGQTFSGFELIVIEDCSTDDTLEIVSRAARLDSRIRVVRNERNSGVVKNLNRGISLAKGRYIARMDSDDLSHPRRLELQYKYMEEHPETGIVGCGLLIDDAVKGVRYTVVRPSGHDELCVEMAKYTPMGANCMLRKSALDEIGLFDTEIGAEEELEILIRMAGRYKIACLPDILYTYFIRSSGRSISSQRFKKKMVMVRLNFRAIRELGLPARLYVFPLGWFIFMLLPANLKVWVRKLVATEKVAPV